MGLVDPRIQASDGEYDKIPKMTKTKKDDPPGTNIHFFQKKNIFIVANLKFYGGSAYLVATREFIDWSLHNETIRSIFEWSRDTYSPDEMVWASISRMPGAPGYRHPHAKWDLNELQVELRKKYFRMRL